MRGPGLEIYHTAAKSSSSYEEKDLQIAGKVVDKLNFICSQKIDEVKLHQWKLTVPGSIKSANLMDPANYTNKSIKRSNSFDDGKSYSDDDSEFSFAESPENSVIKTEKFDLDKLICQRVLETKKAYPEYTRMKRLAAYCARSALIARVENSSTFPSSTPTLSLVSPHPNIGFSPNPDQKNLKLKLTHLVEELISSEDVYVVSMRILKRFYIDPLSNENRELGTPFFLLQGYLLDILEQHESLLHQMNRIKDTSDRIEECVLKLSSAVLNKGIDTHLYESYCNVYESVLRLVKDNSLCLSDKVTLDQEWTQALGNYLEKVQPISRHFDLSFTSLIQKPVARIAKYHLLLETISKNVPQEVVDVKKYIKSVKYKLQKINTSAKEFKLSEVTDSLEQILNLDSMFYEGIQINFSFFGHLILCSAITLVWLDKDKFGSTTCGCFLFKGHLLCAQLQKGKLMSHSRYRPLFLLPLAKCVLFVETRNYEGGIFTQYSKTLKILFEDSGSHFEVLLAFISEHELQVWHNYLFIMINIVHGEKKLNYTENQLSYLVKYPPMQACDISLEDMDNFERRNRVCYFNEFKHVEIRSEYDFEQNSVKIDQNQRKFAAIKGSDPLVVIKKKNRKANELALKDVWSKEISIELTDRSSTADYNRQSLQTATDESSTHKKETPFPEDVSVSVVDLSSRSSSVKQHLMHAIRYFG